MRRIIYEILKIQRLCFLDGTSYSGKKQENRLEFTYLEIFAFILRASLSYTACIRTEEGYCAIQWKESSTTSPDPFGILATTPGSNAAGGDVPATPPASPTSYACTNGFVAIPDLSMDGITGIPVPLGIQAFQSIMCGSGFGVESQTTPAALVCKYLLLVTGNIILILLLLIFLCSP